MTKALCALVLAALVGLATAATALAVSDEGIENGLSVACAQPLVAVMNPNCGWAE